MSRRNQIPSRLFITVVLFSTVLVGCVVASGQMKQSVVRFAILSDRTGSHVPGVYEQIVAEVARLHPDFVMTVGDLVEGYTEDTLVMAAERREYDSLVQGFSVPIYRTPGNHDIGSDLAENWYREHVGKPYYSFDHQGLHFVILDVSRWEKSDELPRQQLEWLRSDLEKNKQARYTLVFFHKPFWYATTSLGKPDTLHTLFNKFGVDAVFTGHFHDYFSGKYDGIMYTSLGSSSGATDPSPTGLQYHFTWVTVDDQGIHVTPIKIGSVLPWEETTAEEYRTFNRIRRTGVSFEQPVPVESNLAIKTSKVVVTLDNSSSPVELSDTLEWKIPEGWSVEPPTLPITVPARQKRSFDFQAACSKQLYPVPTVSIDFNFATQKRVKAQNDLRVARQASCHRADTPPALDGQINEACWQDPVTDFFSPDGGASKIDPVRFYFCYDRDNLYLAAHCHDSKIDSMVAKIKDRDGIVSGEDCVGYFLEPKLGSGIVYQVYFNPLGTVFDQKLVMQPDGYADADRKWNVVSEVKTSKGVDFWTMEARIPLDQFGTTISQGDQWRLNFRRKEKRLNSAADWQVPIDQNPDTYGYLEMK